MICDIFKHSPVFRIGGDEFAALLTDKDFEHRSELLKELKNESFENLRSRTGPIVACGLGVYNPENDKSFDDIIEHANQMAHMLQLPPEALFYVILKENQNILVES